MKTIQLVSDYAKEHNIEIKDWNNLPEELYQLMIKDIAERINPNSPRFTCNKWEEKE